MAMKKANEDKIVRAERGMLRWICGVKLSDRIDSNALRQSLGVDDIVGEMRKRRLRWYGHVMRRDNDWIKKVTEMEIDGERGRGRPKKTWMETVVGDMRNLGLTKVTCGIVLDGEQ